MEYGLDDKVMTPEDLEVSPEKKKRAPFAYWEVDGESYKLKLTTSVICELEDKFKCNLLNILAGGNVPPLAAMLTIVQGAMKTWKHGIRYTDVQKMFDQYCEEGGTQLSLMTQVLIPIYTVSGFFSEAQMEGVGETLEQMQEVL